MGEGDAASACGADHAGAYESVPVDAGIAGSDAEAVGDVGEFRFAVVLGHGEEELLVHVRECSPGGGEDHPPDAPLGFGDARGDVLRGDVRGGDLCLPTVEPDELDHERVSRGCGDGSIEGRGVDAAAVLADRRGNGAPCRLRAQLVDVVARTALQER